MAPPRGIDKKRAATASVVPTASTSNSSRAQLLLLWPGASCPPKNQPLRKLGILTDDCVQISLVPRDDLCASRVQKLPAGLFKRSTRAQNSVEE
mmetsp:Transcript_11990/g.30966  ORF Transcript_11990/g.30966 Transcript_11990/m.30966 type:complete len:94 (-) Transcript_11990:1046-1327(-)